MAGFLDTPDKLTHTHKLRFKWQCSAKASGCSGHMSHFALSSIRVDHKTVANTARCTHAQQSLAKFAAHIWEAAQLAMHALIIDARVAEELQLWPAIARTEHHMYIYIYI